VAGGVGVTSGGVCLAALAMARSIGGAAIDSGGAAPLAEAHQLA
jgi:hypothetical protein